MDDVERELRLARERQAGLLFVGTALVIAVAVGAMQIAGWSGGRLDNRIEPLFWAGGILTALGTACFGLAAVPWPTRTRGVGMLRAGMILFLVGPVLAVTAVFGDYWI